MVRPRAVFSRVQLVSVLTRVGAVPDEDKQIKTIAGGAHLLATTDSNLVNRFTLAFLKRCEWTRAGLFRNSY